MQKIILSTFFFILTSCVMVKAQPEIQGNCGDFFFKKIKIGGRDNIAFLTINIANLTFPKDSLLQIENQNAAIRIEVFAKKNHTPDYCADKKDVSNRRLKKYVFYCQKGVLEIIKLKNNTTVKLAEAYFREPKNGKEIVIPSEIIQVELEPSGG